MSELRQGSDEPQQRVVLLGASNLTRSISTAVQTAQRHCGMQLEVLVAAGHGRSYGLEGSFLGRSLPPILECGLWEIFAARTNVPTTAVVTDIGNDILFNVPVTLISDWIETVLDRLSQAGSRISMTLLPIASAVSVGEFRYRFFRRLYVPGCRLSLAEAVDRTIELSQRLEETGRRRKLKLIEQPRHWYGIDPIHVRLRFWQEVWREALSPWGAGARTTPESTRGSLRRWFYLRTRRPQRRTLFGREQCASQPACVLRSGTTISFF